MSRVKDLGKLQRRSDVFWSRVEVGGDDDCWPWIGLLSAEGYGRFTVGEEHITAHRASWALAHDLIPDSATFICHHCDNPPCVNPAHLFEGNDRINYDDMVRKGRHHRAFYQGKCRNGHVITEATVIIFGNGARRCRTCRNEYNARHKRAMPDVPCWFCDRSFREYTVREHMRTMHREAFMAAISEGASR